MLWNVVSSDIAYYLAQKCHTTETLRDEGCLINLAIQTRISLQAEVKIVFFFFFLFKDVLVE